MKTAPASTLPPPRLDYRAISENITSKSLNALNRKSKLPHDAVASVARNYVEWKRILSELNSKRNERSAAGETIKRHASGPERDAAIALASQLKVHVKELEATLDVAEQNCLQAALSLPNDTHPNAPLGPESAAVTLSTHGPQPLAANPKRDHVAIAEHFDLLDLKSGASVTGTSWYFLRNEAALLELALTNYAMSVAIDHGFTPVTTPDVVKSDIAVRCGFQPRDDATPPVSHMYHISKTNPTSTELILAGTAEIPLAGTFVNKVYPSLNMPLKVVGLGHAFRAEAGARSADTRGLYRVHQFTKIELFAVTTEDTSESMMEDILSVQKSILEGLNLPLRFVLPLTFICKFFHLRVLLLSGFWICRRRNLALARTANTTSRHGCLVVDHGGKCPRYQTAQIISLVACTFAIDRRVPTSRTHRWLASHLHTL